MLFRNRSLLFKLFILSSIILVILNISFFQVITYKVFEDVYLINEYPDPYYNFLLGLICFLFLTLVVGLSNNKHYFYLWIIKAFFTLFIMQVYEYAYSSDSFMYYSRALFWDKENIFANSTDNIIKVTKYFSYIVGDSYYSIKLTFSFFSFVGLVFIFKTYEYIQVKNNKVNENKDIILMYIFFLFPSIIFWSSTLGKDSLNLFFTGIFIYNFIKLIDKYSHLNMIFLLVSIIGVYFIRPWWSIIFSIVIILNYINLKSTKHILILIILAPIVYFSTIEILSWRGVYSFDQLFYRIYETAKDMSFGGSAIEVNDISTLVGYIYYYLPNLFTALFRPMFWDVTNSFMLCLMIENVVLLYIFIKYIVLKLPAILSNKYLRILLSFIFVWSLIYVILSPTNLGIAARFKLQVLPIILILVMLGIKSAKYKYNEKV